MFAIAKHESSTTEVYAAFAKYERSNAEARTAPAAMAADLLLAEMDEEVPQLVVSTQSSGVATTQHFSICAVDDDEEEQEFFFPTFWSSRILPLQL